MQLSNVCCNAETIQRPIPGNPSTQEEAFPEKFQSLRLDARYWVLDITEVVRHGAKLWSQSAPKANIRIRHTLLRLLRRPSGLHSKAESMLKELEWAECAVRCSIVGRWSPTIARAPTKIWVYNVGNSHALKDLIAYRRTVSELRLW